ncbi:retrovirus-related Pol polyprotein from transposon 412 [Trichonephila clavipes]|nr:retrovirus-related Pol polyprotein from transposon 412 [Trichonephila clavipes]
MMEKPNWEVYKTQFCIISEAHGWTEEVKSCQLAASLRGQRTSADESKTQKTGENLREYASEVERLSVNMAFSNLPATVLEVIYLQYFVDVLKNGEIQKSVSAVHETTGCSPSQMFFGRDLRLLADILFSRLPDAPLAPEEYIEKLQARGWRKSIIWLGKESAWLPEKMKTPYDARTTGHDFHEGNKVWVMESETSQRTLSIAAKKLRRSLLSPKKTE